MKITKVELLRLKPCAYCRPMGIRIYTDEGIYGDGEPALAYGNAAEAGLGQMLEFAKLIIGMDPLDNEVIWQKLYRTTFWGLNGGPVIFAGIGAIDMALWDIKGKYFQVPIYKLLGGKRRDKLRGYASQVHFGWDKAKKSSVPTAKTPEEFALFTKQAMADGFDAVKIDFVCSDDVIDRASVPPARYLAELEARVAAVREAGGPNMDIILENHAHTNCITGVAFANQVKKYGIFYYEEACAPDPKMMKYIHDHLDIPIASGERIYSRWQYRPYFEDMSLDIIQPDMGTCGGITELMKICSMAETYDITVQLHTCHTNLSTAAALQVEAALPNFLIHEDNDHGVYKPKDFDDFVTVSYEPVKGVFPIPEAPGIGTEWTEETMRTSDVITVT